MNIFSLVISFVIGISFDLIFNRFLSHNSFNNFFEVKSTEFIDFFFHSLTYSLSSSAYVAAVVRTLSQRVPIRRIRTKFFFSIFSFRKLMKNEKEIHSSALAGAY